MSTVLNWQEAGYWQLEVSRIRYKQGAWVNL
jgi:hypothetical protein